MNERHESKGAEELAAGARLARAAAAATVLALVAAATLPRAHALGGDCGQPASAGASPVASDALFTLRAALGSAACEPCVCDVDGNGAINASDALRILRVAVGQPQELNCPACPPRPCGETSAPECGGVCAEGLTCAREPGTPDLCACLDPCQASPAPTCNGNCEWHADPNSVCRAVTIEPQGFEPYDLCACLPLDVQACADAAAPACGGACPPGTLCGDGGAGSCECVRLATQAPCNEADAPACAGTCAGETVCALGVDGCACVPFEGEDGCAEETAPTCGGACAFGESCAVNIDFTCGCFAPCELADAPACGGACTDEERACVAVTSTVGESSITYCACR